MTKLARNIAPRLANGDSRVRFGSGMPETIKAGLRAIARKERQSMSWVVEQCIIDYFSLDMPKYKNHTAKGRKR